MKRVINIWNNIYKFFATATEDRVDVYSAQAAFFMFLSAFPFALLFLNALAHTAFDESYIIYLINTYIPQSLNPILIQVVNEVYTHASGTLISITAILAIWSASKGIYAIMKGIFDIFNLHQQWNTFIARIISMIYTVFFIFTLIVTMTLVVFGNKLLKLIISYAPKFEALSFTFNLVRYSSAFIILVLYFALLFRILNFKRTTFHTVLPGAVFSALGWSIFSYAFSIYVDNFFRMSYIYGSFTGLVLLMFWLYFCFYIVFLGAEITKFAYPESKKTS
ncbi:MAG: YihY/virulence factor BrkB family protein [Eubacterium sp.]|nr:YihY/virulence factor BrkB family protein [Eubacterium sp.]